MKTLKKIATSLARTDEEARQVGDATSVRAKYALMGVVVALVAVILVPILVSEVRKTTTPEPTLKVDPRAWHVVYGRSPESCDEEVKDTGGCLANPGNPSLWNSSDLRASGSHLSKLWGRDQSELWLGISIPTAVLSQARKIGENQFVLGSISGTYRVWIDGELILDGADSSQGVPAVVPISLGRLEENRALRLAVQIVRDARSPVPDILGAASGEGFTSLERTQYFVYHSLFWNDARPWSLALVHALLAGLFLTLWSSFRQKQEYLYLAVYAMAHAGLEASHIDLVRHRLGFDMGNLLDTILLIYDGAFALFAALAFARNRRVFFKWGVPAALVTPLLLFALSHDPIVQFERTRWIGMTMLPALYVLGAVACGLQSWLVREQAQTTQTRARGLVQFAVVLVVQAGLYFWEAHKMSLTVQPQMNCGFGHVLLAVAISLLVLPSAEAARSATADARTSHRRAA